MKAAIRHQLKGKQGFTLLEVLVAVSILSVGLVALHQGFAQIISVHATVSQTWKAAMHVEQEFTRFQRMEKSLPIGLTQGTFEAEHPLAGHQWKRRVSKESPIKSITMLQIALELTWKERGIEQSYASKMLQVP